VRYEIYKKVTFALFLICFSVFSCKSENDIIPAESPGECSSVLGTKLAKSTDSPTLNLAGTGYCDDDVPCLNELKFRNTKKLDLSENRFSGRGLSEAFENATPLKLNLAENPICLEGLRDVSRITSLTELDLRGVPLQKLDSTALGDLKNLTRLKLGAAGLTDESLAFLSKLPKLRYLQIDDGKLSGSFLKNLTTHGSIIELLLTGQLISDESLRYLAGCPALVSLKIAGNEGMSGQGLGRLAKLESLVYLSLADSGITNEGMKGVSVLSHLTHLDLSRTAITGSGLKYISRLRDLKRLSLAGTALDDYRTIYLRSLIKLEGLDLSDANVSEAALKNFTALTELRDLNLSGNKWVGDFGVLRLLGPQTKLRSLGLAGTQVTNTGRKLLRKSHPELTRIY
jgi:internalin A